MVAEMGEISTNYPQRASLHNQMKINNWKIEIRSAAKNYSTKDFTLVTRMITNAIFLI